LWWGEFFDAGRQERRENACPGGGRGDRGWHAPSPGPAGREQEIGRLLAGVFCAVQGSLGKGGLFGGKMPGELDGVVLDLIQVSTGAMAGVADDEHY